jgi:hypothetical protein
MNSGKIDYALSNKRKQTLRFFISSRSNWKDL